MVEHLLPKILGALALFAVYSFVTLWSRLAELSDSKMTLGAEVDSLARKKDLLQRKVMDLEREKHRLELHVEKIDFQVRDLLPLASKRKKLSPIFFVTPTAYRPAQKADLTRLFQTLSHVANLYWIIVEDAAEPSPFIDEILKRSKLNSVHLIALTPPEKKMNDADPNWKLPRGVEQRNTALQWIRTNFAATEKGVVYFGDDDNTYDWRLFDEMRTIKKVGVWPVGIVGGLLAETPILSKNLLVSIRAFNSIWKPDRPFPFDMAGFGVHISLILKNDVKFTYNSPRGYQESHFLQALNILPSDLEPKANFCSKVYVWHTRTEKTKLTAEQKQKFFAGKGHFLDAELDAIQ